VRALEHEGLRLRYRGKLVGPTRIDLAVAGGANAGAAAVAREIVEVVLPEIAAELALGRRRATSSEPFQLRMHQAAKERIDLVCLHHPRNRRSWAVARHVNRRGYEFLIKHARPLAAFRVWVVTFRILVSAPAYASCRQAGTVQLLIGQIQQAMTLFSDAAADCP